jgi:uncharacterized protein YbjT (DUF2867 family)
MLVDSATHGGPDQHGRSYLLTGTRALSFPQVAAIATEVLDHRVQYLHLPRPVSAS